MNGNDKCYNCEKRVLGCHDRCPDYSYKDYTKRRIDRDYYSYLADAKCRMKKAKGLFQRGVRND